MATPPKRKPSGSDLFGYAKIKPKKFKGGGSPDRGFVEQMAEGVGKSAVRGGPLGSVLEWAKKRTESDVSTFWSVPVARFKEPSFDDQGEELVVRPGRAIEHPIKTTAEITEKGFKRFLKGVAWDVVKGAAAERDRLEWGSIKNQLYSKVSNSPVDIKLLDRFDKAITEGGFGSEARKIDEQMMNMARSRFASHKGDPVVKQFGNLAENAFERQQFFRGVNSGVGWHKKWKKEIFWKGKLPTGQRIRWAPGAVLKRNVINPLKKSLGKTTLGKSAKAVGRATRAALTKVWAVVKKVGVETGKKLLSLLKKVAAKLGFSGVTQTIGQVISQALALVGDTVAPIVSHIIGWLVGVVIGVLIEWTWKLVKFAGRLSVYSCLGCGFSMVLLSSFIAMTIGGAFRLGGVGGPGSPGEPAVLQVQKGVSCTDISCPSAANCDSTDLATVCTSQGRGVHIPYDLGCECTVVVQYGINITNTSSEDAGSVNLIDDLPSGTEYVSGSVLSPNCNCSEGGGSVTCMCGDLPAGESANVVYQVRIPVDPATVYSGSEAANTDRAFVNNASVEGIIGGNSESSMATAIVIRGEPQGLPPSGWPVERGVIIQGSSCTQHSHASCPACIDITPRVVNGKAGTLSIYATHDGQACASYSPVYGNVILVHSPTGTFSSLYGHFARTAIPINSCEEVQPGTYLGRMGSTGNSEGTHLHYEFRGNYQGNTLRMRPPYIPVDIPDGCCSVSDCNVNFGY